MAYQSVTIKAGKGGFGGPLTLVPTDTRNKVVSALVVWLSARCLALKDMKLLLSTI